jgi:pilus assembly protein Flp/PilA
MTALQQLPSPPQTPPSSFMGKSTPMTDVFRTLHAFAFGEDGGQVLEYALIVAVLSLALILTLKPLADDGYFGGFLTRLGICLTTTPCV